MKTQENQYLTKINPRREKPVEAALGKGLAQLCTGLSTKLSTAGRKAWRSLVPRPAERLGLPMACCVTAAARVNACYLPKAICLCCVE
ncbi:hypothetical protein ABD440_08360 [Chromobacterium piscinae]|uniref:hypothetical protein n=1 Tax=Chromobacterium piscinae TaxID=686831 RepID=UPI0031FBD848